jgi:hypothetical protein
LSKDTTAPKNPALYTVENLIAKIMDQCQKVYLKHESMPPEVYIKDSVFRGLVWEMVELKVNPFLDAQYRTSSFHCFGHGHNEVRQAPSRSFDDRVVHGAGACAFQDRRVDREYHLKLHNVSVQC